MVDFLNTQHVMIVMAGTTITRDWLTVQAWHLHLAKLLRGIGTSINEALTTHGKLFSLGSVKIGEPCTNVNGPQSVA